VENKIMKKIAVIGAGTMGNGIAHTFAQCGFEVSLIDINQTLLNQGINTIKKNLDRMLSREKISLNQKQSTLSNILSFTSMEKGLKGVELVVEAATENIGVKLKIFSQLDKLCPPEVILASNTSSISITKIGAATSRPDKVIGMHFMNPVPVMKLVEIIRGYATSNEVTDKIMHLSRELKKSPVEVNDYPGFVANRILMPMINEAIYTLYEGVAGVKEVDTVMMLGMAHPMGPLHLADFIGLDVCLSIMEVLHSGFGYPKYAPCPLIVNMVAAGKLGLKSGEGFYDYSEGVKNKKISQQFLK
jgi:3-hydroxybutyryl-CoA dehydrogenase